MKDFKVSYHGNSQRYVCVCVCVLACKDSQNIILQVTQSTPFYCCTGDLTYPNNVNTLSAHNNRDPL